MSTLRNIAFLLLTLSSLASYSQAVVVIDQVKNSCGGSFNGSFRLTVTSGVEELQYFIFGIGFGDIQTGFLDVGVPVTITGLRQDNYLLSIPDGDISNPNFNTFVLIGNSPVITGSIDPGYPVNNSSCSAPDGQINVSLSGGTGSYIYAWTGPSGFTANTEDISGLAGGNYSLTVTDDGSNCTFALGPISVTDPQPALQNVSNSGTQLVCVGGDAVVNLSGSESGVTYEVLVNGASVGIPTVIGTGGPISIPVPSGNFTDGDILAVEARLGVCTPRIMNGAITTDIVALVLSANISNNSSCVTFNGAIDLSVSGSAGTFLYDWSGPNGFSASTQDISGLEDGTYTVEVTDQPSGCIVTSNFVVGDDTPTLSATAVITDNSRCIAPFNGAIDLTVAGSPGPFTFDWTGPNGFLASTEDITALETGAYQVTITDDNSDCFIVENFNVGDATPTLTLTSVVTDNTRCIAPFNGAIDLTVAGSAGPFTFLWNGPSGFTASTEDITTLVDGDYDVLVTDTGTGCTAVATITVNNAAPTLVLSTVVTDNSRCVAPFNGAIDLTVAGSAGPFTFDWSGPGGPYSTEDLANLDDGVYTVIVTDDNSGCTATTNVTINNVAPTLNLSTVVTDNSRCVAPFNGAIDLTVAGSAGPFTFDWSGPGGPYTTEDLANLQPGNYSVIVTDVPSGCTATTNVTVNDATPVIVLSSTSVDNSRCVAPFNGSIDLSVAGSAGPFTFAWSGPGGPYATEDLTDLQNGIYSVTVTDVPSGCTANTNVTINNISPTITLSSVTTDNSRCVAPFNGAIDLTVAGSAGPFTFAWTGPGGPYATEDLSNLQDGVYSVLVTDDNSGCTASANITINNTAPTLSLSSVVTDNSRCIAPFNGAIDLTVAGSAGPFTFDWSGPNGPFNTEDLTALQDGNYSVLVTDNTSGCTATLNVSVGNTAPVLSLSQVVVPNSQCGTPNGSIDLTVAGSAGPFTFSWTGPSGFSASTEDISGLIGGNYDVTVTDNTSGCQVLATINVPDATATLTITSVVTDNDRCVVPFNGAIDITVAGSAGPFTFLWSGPNGFSAITEDITALENGDYDVTVTETSSGCAVSTTITVGDIRPVFTLATTSIDNIQCAAPFDGSIDLTVNGSAGPFTFDWSGPNGFIASTEDISALEPGTYDVTVTHTASGCVQTTSVIILDNAPTLSLTSVVTDNSACVAPFTGAIDIAVAGSAGPFTFSWTGPSSFSASTEDISGIQDGTYTIVVTDVPSGCSISTDIVVGSTATLPTISASTVVDNDRCSAPFNGAILITVSPAGVYSYQWNGPNGFTSTAEDISALESGAYSVTVTNTTTGCAVVGNFNVGNNAPVITVTADAINDNSSCTAPFNGAILITASPAGTYTYSWTGPNGFTSSSEDITAIEHGDYMVTATNTGLGCSVNAVFTVGDNTPTITITSQTIVDNSNCLAPFNGSIDITAGGTPGPYTFDWTGPFGYIGTGSTITDLRSGDYTVIIEDQTNGCTDSYVLTVGDNTPPITVTLDSSVPNTTCIAPFTGALNITVSGTPGPFTFDWDGPNGFDSADEDITALVHGDYDVTVTDTGLGCQTTVTFTVGDNTPVVTISVDNVTSNSTCIAPFNGAITVSGGGTAGPFDFSWTGPNGFIGTGATITDLEPGDYEVTAEDQILGCQSVQIITVPNAAPVISITQNITPNSNCLAPFNGAIEITSVSGTAGPYDFDWTGPSGFVSTSEDISGLEPGDYTLVVEDTNIGCSNSFVLTVPQNATTVTINLVSATANDRCTAPFNGALDVTIGGTPGPYNITWSGPSGFTAATEDISAVVHGSYTIIVEDVLLGCTNTATFTVPNATVGCGGLNCFAYTITVVDAQTQRPSCSNQNDGVITLDIVGLTAGNYIIQLIGTAGTLTQVGPSGVYTFTGLSPDTYEYRIEDVVGNVCQQPYVLDVQTTVQATASDFVDALCFGQPTGQAIFTVTAGGNSPFEYSLDGTNWITFLSGQTITTLPPNGTYPVLIRDDASDQCPATVTVTINDTNPQITADLTASPATCNNNDGSITINTLPAGGDGGPYTFLFGPVGSEVPVGLPAGNVFSNLAAGNYNFVVTDNAGCQQSFPRTVSFPGFVNTAPPVINNPDCTSGGTNGSIVITLLDVGTYEFAVTTDPLFVPTSGDFTAAGGLTVVVPNLSNGDYFVWLRSLGAQCPTKIGPLTISGVFEVSFAGAANNEICFGEGGGIVLSNITGAPAVDYTYELVSNGIPLTGNITFLEALDAYTIGSLVDGSYQLRIIQDQTALNGCVVSTDFQSFTISGPASALGISDFENIMESYPDLPTGSMRVILQESGEEDYEIKVELTEPIFGNQFFFQDFTVVNRDPSSLRMEAQLNSLYAGKYEVTVRDALGCEVVVEIDIPLDTDIFIPNIFTPNGDGHNDTFTIRNLPGTGARLIISNRWGKQVFSSNNYTNDNAWNGGDESDGVYYYRLQADGQVFTGWVEILRGVKP
ncbi:MAG: gliding motility-associated C-terminal domain-containing protein [Cyclobacteriaceae bacterium]|nr:MAG: gliding motility-associated C-terminal domain-containing protein [Cyclobacteriaceae bacterium]